MQLPGAPHARYAKVNMGEKNLDYNPENPDEYVLFEPIAAW